METSKIHELKARIWTSGYLLQTYVYAYFQNTSCITGSYIGIISWQSKDDWEHNQITIFVTYLRLIKLVKPFEALYKRTRPCEQGNWDTWVVLDPWNQV